MLAEYGQDCARLYYSHPRPEILHLIPREARRLLDVGCGGGALGATVKARQDCYYFGIEPHAPSVTAAKKVLDKVYCSTIEKTYISGWEEHFDCIIFADVLEHLKDPLETLRQLSVILKPNGTIVASLPNISHPHIVQELAAGLFRYVNAGILDKTHLRFFTNISAQQMFASARLRVTSVTTHPSTGDPQQYIYTLKKLDIKNEDPQLTILIPMNNLLDTTKACINSLRRSTLKNIIILCLDNGSTDDTISWLRDQGDILSIRSGANMGFVIGNNLMLPCVTTPYFLLSNADTLYPRQALADLIDTMQDLGPRTIIGPAGSHTSGPQNCRPLSFTDFITLDYAYAHRKDNMTDTLARIHRLVFFCTLMPTGVLRDVGFLNEIFSPGNFEDDDYCLRAIEKGYSLYYVPYIYVHHYGGTSFKRNLNQYRALLSKNHVLFNRIWSARREQILSNYYSPRNSNDT